MNWYNRMVPRACFYIDSTVHSTLESFELMLYSSESIRHRKLAEEDLERIWLSENENYHIISCLSVRSALDLFLLVKSYPAGSEIIMSAINIPSIVEIIHHHELKICPCDLDIDTLAPSSSHLQSLINEKTVAVFIAHIYGKRCDIGPLAEVCKKYSAITLLEDCAESFTGLDYTGHPESDISLFSFGTIKFSTAFGGAIAKIKDKNLCEQMRRAHDLYPIQSKGKYALKLTKYALFSVGFNNAFVFKYFTGMFRLFGVDHKDVFVPMLRGFPSNLIEGIRQKPSVLLLNKLTFRLLNFDDTEHQSVRDVGDYITKNLPPEAIAIGTKAHYNSYWLYPILVKEPGTLVTLLNKLGVDASSGTTQLGLVPDDGAMGTKEHSSTPSAKFLIDHVVYLPVHKRVTFPELDRIVLALENAFRVLGWKPVTLPPRG